MLKQDHATETPPSQAHYSPEEAGEILRIAAHLQDNTITASNCARLLAKQASQTRIWNAPSSSMSRVVGQQRNKCGNALLVDAGSKWLWELPLLR
jgi:hypothetical protein